MATYKAEFLSHYYKGRFRPLNAYAMGMIGDWAVLAGAMPLLTNMVTQTPGLSSLAKAIGGIAPERNIPRFASVPFRRQFAKRQTEPGTTPPSGGKVLLWPDTFNNYFHPETAMAAVEVLETPGSSRDSEGQAVLRPASL